ncbi:MAG: chemotaxis response regulator protein-glutamate methylesterase [Heteroscytonema crispum UTEX LB 1556]
MPKIRVLIVDDAVVVRSRVSKVLSGDRELEVVGVAANGRIALAKIPQVNPDVVILDVEMPEMNGLETLAAIRKIYPLLPVIMFSTSTRTGATATLEALSLGATDYATKPSNLGSLEAANQHICQELIPKIKLFGSGVAQLQISNVPPKLNDGEKDFIPSALSNNFSTKKIDVLAIGVSTGGPNALDVLLSQLRADFPIPILIVQHMPPMFTKLLAERLASKCKIRVDEAVPGAVLEPGKAWIAPGDFHMIVQRDGTAVRIATNQAPPENSCRPSVDVLFRSVAEVYGAKAIAVVLTGMGKDGLRGCECIREVKGQIIVQDKASSVVWGMPGFVAQAGLADRVIPLDQMAEEIIWRIRQN